MLQEEIQRVLEPRALGARFLHQPDRQPQEDGELRLAEERERARDEQDERLAAEGDEVGVEDVQASVCEFGDGCEKGPPPWVHAAWLRVVENGPGRAAVCIWDEEDGAHCVPEYLVADEDEQEGLESAVFDAAQLETVMFAELHEAAFGVEMGFEAQIAMMFGL